MARDIFDAVKNVRRRNAIKKPRPGGGGTRENYNQDFGQKQGPVGPAQYDPFTQSDMASWMDWAYGGGVIPSNVMEGSFAGATNISDLNDYFAGGGQFQGQNFDSYWDWYNWMTSEYQDEGQQQPNLNTAGTSFYNVDVDPWMPGGTGGGNQGGPGDLGTGSYFAGGGMGTSMFGGSQPTPSTGLWEQDCSQIGPQYNMQGECIACCENQYAGTGFYGDPDWESGGGGGTIDPDMGGECLDMYQAAGGANSGMDYGTFEGLYC